ncbi:MAG: hypothetical protein ACYS8K_09325, partial [Planctomycetota bacterium]
PEGWRVDYNGQFHTCINGGYYHEQGGAILREVLASYPLDGVFFNMFGFWTRDYSGNYHGICHCEGCREAFRDETGLELPASEEPGTPGLPEYRAFCLRKVGEMAQFMHDLVREFGDHIAVSTWMFHPAIDIIRMESNRSLRRACPEFHHLHSAWAVNRTKTSFDDRTVCCCANHFFDIPYRFASEPAGLTAARIAGNLCAGGHLDFYMLGTFDQPDKEGFGPIREVYRHQEKHERHYRDLRSLARVLLVEDEPHSDAFRGFYAALLHKQVPFDVLAASELDRWAAGSRFDRYAVVVMADSGGLPPETAGAVDDYVERGGRLLAAGRTGFAPTEDGAAREECLLQCTGLRSADRLIADSRGTYCMLDDDPLEDLPETRAFMVHGEFAGGARAPGARAVYPAQRGLYGPPEKVQWWDDPADCPVEGEYGAYHMAYGKGESIYFPFDIGRLYWLYYQSAHRELIGHWVRCFLAGDEAPRVGVRGAPLSVQLTVHRIGGSRDVIAHLLNYSGCQKNHAEMPLPVRGMTLCGTGGPSGIVSLGSEEELEVHRDERGWSAALPEVGLFAAILVEEML